MMDRSRMNYSRRRACVEAKLMVGNRSTLSRTELLMKSLNDAEPTSTEVASKADTTGFVRLAVTAGPALRGSYEQ